MSTSQRVDVDSVLDAGRMSRSTLVVILLCASVALLDGFDTQSISLAAPALGPVLHLQPSGFGTVFGIGLFGGLIGATVAGMIGDRVGRKPLVTFGVMVFGVVTLVTPSVSSVGALETVRFFTGIGLGTALPGIISLTSEYAPAKSRATIVGMMFCGFPMGAVVGGVVANWLIPAQGWGSVFYVGGVAPLLLLPLLVFKLPESARFLSVRGDSVAAAKTLERLGIPAGNTGAVDEGPGVTRSPVAALFKQGNGPGTVLLWAAMFLTLVMTYFLVTWLPSVAVAAGAKNGLLAVSTLNLGGVLGCLVIGRIADRRRPAVVIGSAYAVGAVFVGLIGWATQSDSMLLVVTFVAGLLSVGAQMCTIPLVAHFYNTRERATGVGWSMGWGRLGGITGPVVGGWLIGAGLAASSIFLLAGGVSVCAALVLFGFSRLKLRATAPATVKAPVNDAASLA
ncbi:MAG: transporter, family, 4-hydroxybenzoate transporter [Streptomyces sp.]|nr:transporter, family, 4-hydroxybenzoate transporter [Streptomyces sp.]